MEMPNEKIVSLELKRIDLCDLLLACTAAEIEAKNNGSTGEKWDKLWHKLHDILWDFDAENNITESKCSDL